jgi:hypothetical protein
MASSGSTLRPSHTVNEEPISQYPSVDSEMLDTFREDMIPSLVRASEQSEIAKAKTVLHRDSLSEAQK